MSDPTRIYLQPECCAGPETGRMWCEDPNPEECEEGNQWAEYVLVEEAMKAKRANEKIVSELQAEVIKLLSLIDSDE